MATALAAPNAGVCAAGAPNVDGVLNPPANPPKVIFLSNERAGMTVSQTVPRYSMGLNLPLTIGLLLNFGVADGTAV